MNASKVFLTAMISLPLSIGMAQVLSDMTPWMSPRSCGRVGGAVTVVMLHVWYMLREEQP